MKLLTAARGNEPDDFHGEIAVGEIVEPAFVCDIDYFDDTIGNCGCGRAFRGLSTGALTTAAIVQDVNIDRHQLAAMIVAADQYPQFHQSRRTTRKLAAELRRFASPYDIGTTCAIWRYEVSAR